MLRKFIGLALCVIGRHRYTAMHDGPFGVRIKCGCCGDWQSYPITRGAP